MIHLNPQQMRAVSQTDGPLLILAGAGTGKTRVVTERMARLLDGGVPPANILGVTFTNKAAAEMRSRLAERTGKRHRLRDLVLATFHSLAVRLLRRDARLLGYTPGFSVCDYGEQLSLLRKAAATVRAGAGLKPEDALRRISSLKNRGISPEAFGRSAIDEDEILLHALYRRYQDALRRQNSLDFDDLLMQSLALFTKHPETLEHWRDRFRYIMVDEFQDTNAVQFDLVRLLAAPRNNLCVVGDDDQSIYAWRGAMAGNILTFRDSYPDAAEVTLEQNYRSTSAILSAANAVIKNNGGRREKNLWSDLGAGDPVRLVPWNDQFEEADGIAHAIRERAAENAAQNAGRGKKAPFGDFAVLLRANAQARPLEDAFLAARIPYQVIGGQSLFERKEARDVLSYLSLLANPDADNHILRILNTPPRGIGEKSVDLLQAHAVRTNAPLSGLLAHPERVEGLSKAATDAVRRFAEQIGGWKRLLAEDGLPGIVRRILDDVGYREEVERLYPDPLAAAARWNEALDVGESLERFAARHDNGGKPAFAADILAGYLAEAALAGRQEEPDRDAHDDAVRIITVHSAKGLEFPFVFIPGLEEEIFPHKNAIEADTVEEERRLFYVALTRARRELTLSWNRCRVIRGKEQKRDASRFLDEIPDALLDRLDTATREEEAVDWIAGVRARLNA